MSEGVWVERLDTRPPRSIPRHWSPEQAREFLALMEGDRLYPLWAFLLSSGLRIGELVWLRWSNVELARRRVHVVDFASTLSEAGADRRTLGRDHNEYEPGIVTGHLRHARLPLDPRAGDYLVVGDDEVAPALALVVSRDADGTIRLRILPGPVGSHEEYRTRRLPTLAL